MRKIPEWLHRSDRAGFALVLGFVGLAAAVVGTALLASSQQHAVAWVNHTLEVENRLSTILSRLVDAETGERGFLLTGLEEYLGPYDAAIVGLDRDLSELATAINDNPRQREPASRLRALAEARENVLREEIDTYRRGNIAAAINSVKSGRGKKLMDEMRGTITSMRAEEQNLFVFRNEQVARQADLLLFGLVAIFVAVVLLATFAFRNLRLRLTEVSASRDALSLMNDRLAVEAATRERAEMQVRQMQRLEAVGQLTGGIAHDFNNMLAIVLGSLELAKRRLDRDRTKAEVCIDNAIEGARRAAQLTGRLLAFSRQQALAPQGLDANKLVGSLSEMMRRTIGENLRVETVLAGGLWRVYADPVELENALLNLCVNARDAMPEGGRLTIETSNSHLDDAYASEHVEVKPGQYVMMSVTDTGVGMPPEVVERAFDPFYTTKGVGKGTGLGLSQVHGFIKQSGGHVKIYSEPGVGTTVKLYLPRYSDLARTVEKEEARIDKLERATGEEVILVVEDDERVRHVSVDSLRELGYTVVQAADAAQALSIFEIQPRVDLLFTDVVMPDMNGRRLAEKALEARPDLKVLYTTGYTRNAVVHNGVIDADVAFLPKPYTIDQLAAKIRQVLLRSDERS